MSNTRTILVATSAAFLAMTTLALAKNTLSPGSIWYEKQNNWCLTIDKVSEPLQGSDECLQITGSRNRSNPIAGYLCEQQRTIGFFANITESDNSIKPDFFVGTFTSEAIDLQYCYRPNNDLLLEFDCTNSMKFTKADKCPP